MSVRTTAWMAVATVMSGLLAGLAADVTWDGDAGDGQWNNDLNWSGNAQPGSGDRVIVTTNGFGTAARRIYLGASRTINELRLVGESDDAVLDGEGLYSLRIGNGKITAAGWPAPRIRSVLACDVILGSSGSWNPTDNWSSYLYANGHVTDEGNGYSMTFGSSQNMNIVIGGSWDIGGTILVQNNSTRIGGVYTNASDDVFYGGTVTNAAGIYLGCRLGSVDQSDTTLIIENQYQADSDRIQGATKLGTLWSGGSLICNGHPTDPVAERVSTLDLQSGRLGLLRVDAKGAQTDLIFNSVERASGTSVGIDPRNGGRIIVEGSSNTNGIWQPWCFYSTWYTKVGASNDIIATVSGDYTALAATGNDSARLHKFSSATLSLEEDTSVWGLRWDASANQTLDLGTHDLTIGSGAMIVAGSLTKTLTSAGGQMIFAGEDLIYNVEGSGAFTNSAPVAWSKPAGSTYACPSLVFTRGNRTDGIVLDGEDRIGTYSNLFNYAYYGSARRTLTLAGPSDRTFTGTLTGVFNLDKRGGGTLTFAGSNARRSGGLNVYEGRVVLAHATAPAPTVYEDAVCEIVGGVDYNSRPVIQAGGTLAGSGTILQSMGTAQLLSGARLAPGTSSQAACFTFNSTVALAGDVDFDIKIDTATNDLVRVVNTFTLPPSGSTFTFRVSDLTHGAAPIDGRDFVVVRWAGTLANAGNTINYVVENASPATLDTTDAVVTLNGSARTITISGVRAVPKGTLIMAL